MLNVAQRLEALVGTADGATAHHYDLSNDFYRLLLDDHVAYSSACFTDDRQTLPEAQTEKVDLICRKRVLAEGLRLLDVGCGWGSLILFAARRYGVHATGIAFFIQRSVNRAPVSRVAMPSSSNRRHHVGYVRSLCTRNAESTATVWPYPSSSR